jgi:hypothetical protein
LQLHPIKRPSGPLSAPAAGGRYPSTPHTCGGSRHHGHLYFPAETWELNSSGPISRPACHYTRRPVSDSPSKLVTAVTRARVDHPSFLCYSAPSQTGDSKPWLARINANRELCLEAKQVECQCLGYPRETGTCDCLPGIRWLKVYRFALKMPCSILTTLQHWPLRGRE